MQKISTMNKCDCISYNQPQDYQKTQSVVLELPKWCAPSRQLRNVCIDSCVVDVVKELWKRNLHTLSVCCGHNKCNPSLVVYSYQAIEVVDILRVIDEDRNWDIFYWNEKERFKITKDSI